MRTIRIVLMAAALLAIPAGLSASVFISVHFGPPALPVYVQPPCPTSGYLWTPGYWAYGPAGYYWVPGVWVRPPAVGVLWTPGYWGFGGGVYLWHAGYWGPHVGFYGGINYGGGYTGVGFVGGRWRGGGFYYNRAVTNVSVTNVRNVYVDRTVIRTTVYNHASFNGPGGVMARPTWQQQAAARERHFAPTSNQVAHVRAASFDRSQFASANHGRPPVTAMNTINGRRYTQQGRIANGVGSGRLTPRETRNLQGRETNLNRQIRADRQQNGGRLTPQERQQMRARQNNMSRSIYRDNHNRAADRYGNSEVGQRRARQQQRIAQGVRSGQMSPGEAARSERREQNLNRRTAADRRANGGRLTPQERRNINRRQNGASRQIDREKHNAQTGPR
ncbi:MAG: YXWGXW repeat-containing protein [Terriglobia bacterium]